MPTPDEQYADRLRTHLVRHREDVLVRYTDSLIKAGNALGCLPERDVRQAAGVVLDHALGRTGNSDPDVAELVGERRAVQLIPPAESVKATTLLFGVVAEESTAFAHGSTPESLGLASVLRELHESILGRVAGAAHHDERRRIARNLHDQIAQAIAVCLQQLELRDIALRNDPAEAERRLELLRTCLLQASELVHELALEVGRFQTGQGFLPALHRFLELQGADNVTLDVTDPQALEAAPSWTLEEFYYAVREGILNALTHSGTDSVEVAIGVLDQTLRATIEDRGKGLDPALLHSRAAGTGLVSLRERIELLGGRASLHSEAGSGTTLDLRVPLYL